MNLARRILYYALLPVEWAAYLVQGTWSVLKWLIIVSNPLFLAIWLMNRNNRDRDRKEAP